MNSKTDDEIIYSIDLSSSGVLVLRPQKQLKGKPRGKPWPKGVLWQSGRKTTGGSKRL